MKTQDPRFGYNITSGGDGVSGWHPSEKTRKKISESAKKRIGELNPNFGHSWTSKMKMKAGEKHRKENLSEETLKKMSNSAKGRIGDRNSFFGKHHSDETRKMLSALKSRPVKMFGTSGNLMRTFPSIKDAAREMGISGAAISNCCRGITRTSGGYIWKYDN